MTKRLLFGFLLAFALGLSGDDSVLIPTSPGVIVSGRDGSVWYSKLTAYNSGDYPVIIYPRVTLCPPFECFDPITVQPGQIFDIQIEEGINDPPVGRFLYVSPDADNVHFQLVIREGENSTVGASVPVIRVSTVASANVQLLDIPACCALRSSLRIYDLDAVDRSPFVVHVRLFDTTFGRNELVAEFPVEVRFRPHVHMPGYAEVHNLQERAPTVGQVFRVEVVVPAERKLWAFVSTTSNTDNAVLVTVPMRP